MAGRGFPSLFPRSAILKRDKTLTTWADESTTSNGSNTEHEFDASAIFEAPDYASLLKHSSSASAKEYEAKIQSMLKAGVFASLRSGNDADAATLLHYGPGLAQSIGDFTDVSDKAKRVVDILTAPDSPALVFVATAIPMIMQFMRNHEKEIEVARMSRKEVKKQRAEAKLRGEEIPAEKRGVTIKLPFGRSIRIPISVRFHLISNATSIFRSQTYEPDDLKKKVFSDPKVLAAIKKNKAVFR